MKKFIIFLLLFFACLNLHAGNYHFNDLNKGAMLRIGKANSIMYEKDHSYLLELGCVGNIRVHKSLFLQGEINYGVRFAEPSDGTRFDITEYVFDLSILLSYKYRDQAVLLGPYFGTLSRQGTYEPDKQSSGDFGICVGYEYYLTRNIFLGLRLNIGLIDTYGTQKNYSGLLGIGYFI